MYSLFYLYERLHHFTFAAIRPKNNIQTYFLKGNVTKSAVLEKQNDMDPFVPENSKLQVFFIRVCFKVKLSYY